MGLLWFTVCAAFALSASTDSKLIYGCVRQAHPPVPCPVPSGIFGKKQVPSPMNNLSTQFQFGQFEQLVRFSRPKTTSSFSSCFSSSRASSPYPICLPDCLPRCPSVCLSRFLHCLGTFLVQANWHSTSITSSVLSSPLFDAFQCIFYVQFSPGHSGSQIQVLQSSCCGIKTFEIQVEMEIQILVYKA